MISFAQNLNLVDFVECGFGRLSELRVSKQGDRFFVVNRASDSLKINGHQFYVPPKDTIPGSPYRFGRSYVAGVPSDNNSDVFIHRPGGEILRLTDSSMLVFTTIYEDSLVTDHGIFVNHADGNGTNLLLMEYDFDGTFLRSKHWKSTDDVSYVIQDGDFYNDQLFLVGTFSAGQSDQLLELDAQSIGYLSGFHDAFLCELDENLEIKELVGMHGDLNDYIFRIAVNRDSNILVSGSSTSNFVYNSVCMSDTIYNPSLNPWRSTFMYLNQFSLDYKCLQANHANFDFDGGLVENIITLTDGSYLIYGVYGAGYLQYNSVSLENPNYHQSSYIIKFSSDLEAIKGLQVKGSPSSTRIADIAVDIDDDLWVCGYSSGDTVIFDDCILTRGSATSKFWSFLAKLDSDLNVLQIRNMGEEECKEVVKGDDDEMYLRTQVVTGHERVYRIVDSVSAVIDYEVMQDEFVRLYPNPARDKLFYQIDPSISIGVTSINIYFMNGNLAYHTKDISQQTGINLNLPDGLYFVKLFLSDGTRFTKKVVIHR